MKLILLVVAIIALAKSSEGLKCYNCRQPNYESSFTPFRSLKVCGDDKKQWPDLESNPTAFEKCKKITEKVMVNNKEETLVIRTTGIKDMGLNTTLFTEYTCDTDLCNSAVTMSATAFAVVFSIAVTLTKYV